MKAKIERRFNWKILKDVINLENSSFPKEWIYDDAEEYYMKMLKDKNNINIFLEDKGKRIGYILAIPHNNILEELKKEDPELKKDSKKYYVDTIEILPWYRGGKGVFLMIQLLFDECKKKGTKKISMHARVNNGLSRVIQRKYNAINIRRIEKWPFYNLNEPTDYIEILIKNNEETCKPIQLKE